MLPSRIQNIEIQNKSLLSVLYGKVNDLFISGDAIQYNFEEIIYLYLKNQGFDSIVFYSNVESFYSYSNRDLEILLTDSNKIEPTIIKNNKRRGPLGIVINKPPYNQQSETQSFAEFNRFGRKAYRSSVNKIVTIITQALENTKFKTAIIVNQAMLAGTSKTPTTDTSFFSDSTLAAFLMDRFANQHSLPQQHKIIFNYGTQETFKEGDLPNEIMNQLFFKENENIFLKNECQINIGLPQKDEIENLLNYLRFDKNKVLEFSDFDKIAKAILKEKITINNIEEKLSSLNLIDEKTLIESKIVKSNKIDINFEKLNISSIKGQNDNLEVISAKLKIWTSQKIIQKPLSFFAVGTSGVGKTLTANKISNALLDSGFGYLELSMNEFASEADSWKLIGSTTGYSGSNETPILFKKIKENRRLIICFDEIEKAHPSILTLLMQLIESGKLNNNNYEGDFKECILFFTSNLAQKEVLNYKLKYLENNYNKSSYKDLLKAEFQKKVKEILEKTSQKIPTEVWGRIDTYLVYNSLSYKDIMEISIDYIRKLCKENYDIEIINIDPNFLSKLAKDHSNSKYGARDLIKEISSEIHLMVADL